MSILDRARAHYDSLGSVRIEVPEWKDENGDPTVLYAEPMTLEERRKLDKFASDSQEYLARLVITKALDEDGNKAFRIEDKPILMKRVSDLVIARIAGEIARVASIEEQTGN
jgi:hypothetical protein